jgi:uncharacterized protein
VFHPACHLLYRPAMSNSFLHDHRRLPARAGVGLKAEHCRTILEVKPDMGFFEVHAENYMGAGGPPHRFLTAIRDRYPLSIHGVGLSIGASCPLDQAHLQRLNTLLSRYAPAFFSEHLAWSSHDCGFLNDLLPIPYTTQSLARVVEHIDQVQETLARQVLLENPSTYVAFEESTYAEVEFISAVARQTGCGLLLDVNNAYVASINQQWDPLAYLDAYPLAAVQQIHLAGHARQTDDRGCPLLIDTHDRHVADEVWSLFAHVVRTTGPLPTLIEWDTHLPDWNTLAAEAARADAIMHTVQLTKHPSSATTTQHQPSEVTIP